MAKPALFGKTLEELKSTVAELSLPPYTARQIAEWLYKHRACDFHQMTNLSKTARVALSENFDIGIYPHSSVAVSSDGTKKYLFSSETANAPSAAIPPDAGLPHNLSSSGAPPAEFSSSANVPINDAGMNGIGPEPTGRGGTRAVEAAWIPEEKRGTLCVSTQVGCRRGCRFCMTARQGFQGNLSAGEILNQYRSLPESDEVTHFVFMGMGEPLDNLDSVLAALEILVADWGFSFSPRKITVSTIGILEGLEKLIEKSECRLALSLHSPFPDERATLIPYERRYPVKNVLDLLRRSNLGKRRLTIEYLMINERNDSKRHAAELAKILEGLGARVNLIPYHPIPDFPGTASTPSRIRSFRDELERRGIVTTLRRSRGLDIDAACGLLSTRRSAER